MKGYIRNADLDADEQRFIQHFCQNTERKYANEPCGNGTQYGNFVYWNIKSLLENLRKACPCRKHGQRTRDRLVEICWELMAAEESENE
ncbi:MAG: hypothetical protein LBG21_00090 [Campylobacteraceae bacterium]|jgi:hypothetical protein|nr:hypothetical protein [Campylobacteraceae bacterium]